MKWKEGIKPLSNQRKRWVFFITLHQPFAFSILSLIWFFELFCSLLMLSLLVSPLSFQSLVLRLTFSSILPRLISSLRLLIQPCLSSLQDHAFLSFSLWFPLSLVCLKPPWKISYFPPRYFQLMFRLHDGQKLFWRTLLTLPQIIYLFSNLLLIQPGDFHCSIVLKT